MAACYYCVFCFFLPWQSVAETHYRRDRRGAVLSEVTYPVSGIRSRNVINMSYAKRTIEG